MLFSIHFELYSTFRKPGTFINHYLKGDTLLAPFDFFGHFYFVAAPISTLFVNYLNQDFWVPA